MVQANRTIVQFMEEYRTRLAKAMKNAQIDATKLASELDLSYQAVKKVLDGKSGSFTAANNAKAAGYLSVSPDWLATGRGPMNAAEQDRKIAERHGAIVIPQFDAGGAMGHGRLVLADQPGVIHSWYVTPEWMRKNAPYSTSPDNLCIVTGFGDSMLGMFNPGDPLLVDRGINRCDVDGVYFFRVGDEGFIKRLQRVPGEGILVISENNKYRDWTIKPDADFQVLAKVVKVWEGSNY